jgi:hypothetical protein
MQSIPTVTLTRKESLLIFIYDVYVIPMQWSRSTTQSVVPSPQLTSLDFPDHQNGRQFTSEFVFHAFSEYHPADYDAENGELSMSAAMLLYVCYSF